MSEPTQLSPDTSWGSHIVPLMACVCATTGPVLELGCGHWSTPLLHRYCAAAGRKLVTLDEDKEFLNLYKGLAISGHELHHVDYNEALPRLATEPWSVVLVDHSPGWRRATDSMLFLGSAEWLVVHDYSGDEVFKVFDPVIENWRYRIVFTYSPSTLVLSNNGHKLPDHYFAKAVDEGTYMHRLREIGEYPVGVR